MTTVLEEAAAEENASVRAEAMLMMTDGGDDDVDDNADDITTPSCTNTAGTAKLPSPHLVSRPVEANSATMAAKTGRTSVVV